MTKDHRAEAFSQDAPTGVANKRQIARERAAEDAGEYHTAALTPPFGRSTKESHTRSNAG